MNNIIHRRMSIIFNEWVKRYSDNKDSFDEILNSDGTPIEDYGDRCATYFIELSQELNEGNCCWE